MPAMNTGSPYLTNGWLILALLLFTGCGEKKVATTPGTINSTPLAPMEGKDAPLFEKLDPASTGLTRAPKIDPKHPERRLYATGYSVGGIAVGDVNNDNKPDIFISSGPGQTGSISGRAAFRISRRLPELRNVSPGARVQPWPM